MYYLNAYEVEFTDSSVIEFIYCLTVVQYVPVVPNLSSPPSLLLFLFRGCNSFIINLVDIVIVFDATVAVAVAVAVAVGRNDTMLLRNVIIKDLAFVFNAILFLSII